MIEVAASKVGSCPAPLVTNTLPEVPAGSLSTPDAPLNKKSPCVVNCVTSSPFLASFDQYVAFD